MSLIYVDRHVSLWILHCVFVEAVCYSSCAVQYGTYISAQHRHLFSLDRQLSIHVVGMIILLILVCYNHQKIPGFAKVFLYSMVVCYVLCIIIQMFI